MEDRRALFDAWAEHYDASVVDESSFPFTRYRETLATTLSAVDPSPGQSLLDVGCGAGNLSLLFALAGCDVTGMDFSPPMLKMAQQRVPGGRVLQMDMLDSWDAIAGQQFDVIASAYVFHEFDLANKLATITLLVEEHLKPGGRIVLADISFTARADMEGAQAEFYWIAPETIASMPQRGLAVTYTPVPPFAGVCAVTPTSV